MPHFFVRQPKHHETELMTSAGRTIAIGDIHGCDTALNVLLQSLDVTTDDTIVMLGDAIDRGPNSCGVIDRLLHLREECLLVPILGNHEQMLLDVRDGEMPLANWLMYGGAETLDSYDDGLESEHLSEHVEFIRTWGDYHKNESHFFAHGNYLPEVPLSRQPWERVRWESLRVAMPTKHYSGRTAVLGHTSNKQGKVLNAGHLVCVDTYCHGGNWLTAFEPATGQLWQANQQGEVQELKLPPP